MNHAAHNPPQRSVLSIGTFDGVHLGHQALMRQAREIARINPGSGPPARVIALVFDPNPLGVLRPGAAPARLTTFSRRRELLLDAGADEVVLLQPTPDLLGLSAEDFVRRKVEQYHPIAFVEGEDFRFGNARTGDVRLLADIGRVLGFSVRVVPGVSVALTDHAVVPARSTMVRWLLGHGRVRDAACVLGRPYELSGLVVRGDRRGRGIGFPTANLDSPCVAPADGVYAARARLEDGRVFAAAVSVGTKPTFGTHARAVEAFLILPDRRGDPEWRPVDGLPEYGWTLRLELVAWIREQIAFTSLDPLLEQMARDCDRAADIAAEPAPAVPAFDHRAMPKEALA